MPHRTASDLTYHRLSSTRKKRPIPADWAAADSVTALVPIHTSENLYPGAKSIAVDAPGEVAIFGGVDGVTGLYSLTQEHLLTALKGEDGPITDVAWFGIRPVTGSASGVVRIWDENNSAKIGSHAGEVTALALHPCKDLLVSVGVDKSWVTYDLNTGKAVCQVYTESGWQNLDIILFYDFTNIISSRTYMRAIPS